MKRVIVCVLSLLTVLALAACGGQSSSGPTAAEIAQAASNQLQKLVYQSKHNVEFRNYNWRQEISDDPATILWCTFFPPGISGVSNGTTPGQAFTVPIAGKLTSSNKRPYRDTSYVDAGNYSWYPQERPGPDHMFGGSAEYRYGFGPAGKADYHDFTGFASTCNSVPEVWQANTPILTGTSTTLQSLSNAAEAALRAGNVAKAETILNKAGNVKAGK